MVKLFGVPHESTFRHLHFKGVFTVKVRDGKQFKMTHYGYQLENELFWGGLFYRYEKESLRLWTLLCEDAHVILDIGANTGLFSLTAQAINPGALVYAFEPVNRVYRRLLENIAINKFPVYPVEIALSGKVGVIEAFDTVEEHEYTFSLDPRFGSDPDVTRHFIQTDTLEHFVSEREIPSVDLIKLDVEYHEPEVIRGMGKLIEKFHPTFLVEVVEDEIAADLHALLGSQGYLFFDIDESKGLVKQAAWTKSTGINCLICLPVIARKLSLIS